MRGRALRFAWLALFLCVAPQSWAQQGVKRLNPTVAPAASGRRVALVIGNVDYAAQPLKSPVNDANAIAATLTKLGFKVWLGQNLKLSEMASALSEWGTEAKNASLALFYYAGHGMQINGANFLIPTDAQPTKEEDVEGVALNVERVLAELKAANPDNSVVILDASRDDPFASNFRPVLKGLAQLKAPPNTLIAYSVAPGETANDNPDSKTGLYTQELLKQMVKPGAEIEDVFKNVRTAVELLSRQQQTPWEDSALAKSFCLAGKPAVPGRNPAGNAGNEKGDNKAVGKLTRNPVDGAELVSIPAGEFTMGSTEEEIDAILQADSRLKRERLVDEAPLHKIDLAAYYIYKTPVTVAQYLKFCKATGHTVPEAPDFNPNWSKTDHPIVNVSWNDAQDYCIWASKKSGLTITLPTEAQWEKAARGAEGLKFPWGADWDASRCANSVGAELAGTVAVGSLPQNASPYGVLDMAGNVWQWCADWYDNNYYAISADKNPPGPTSGQNRVLRGGSWREIYIAHFRCAARDWNTPDCKLIDIGFRCVARPVLASPRPK